METSSLNRIDLDLRALGFLGAVSVVTVFLFGLPSALLAGRGAVSGVLQIGSRSAAGSVAARRFRAGLVVAEVALSIVLLAGAALMTRSLLKLEAIDIGLDPDRLLAMQIALPAPAYADPALREDFTSRVLTRLRTHPSVIAATAGALPPREHLINVGGVEVGDRPGEKTKSSAVPVFEIRPGYFATAGIRLLEGREPYEGDPDGAAVVSQGFAAAHWPGQSPLGRRFRIGKGPWRTVVGVATEVRARSEREQSREFELYYPRGQAADAYASARPVANIAEYQTILLRTSGAGATPEDLAGLVHDIDPRVIVGRTSLVSREFADAIARPRIVFLMMAVFAGFGLVLAAAGLYGVLSHLVSQRMREIGIRLALGATPRAIGRVILGNGLGLAAAGIVIGLAAALGLVKTMQAMLYEVEPADSVSFAAVCGIVLVTAAIAAWRPAGRAMRVDPITLLREE
jgi:predicted permease